MKKFVIPGLLSLALLAGGITVVSAAGCACAICTCSPCGC